MSTVDQTAPFRSPEEMKRIRKQLVREQHAVTVRKFFHNKLSVVGLALVMVMLSCACTDCP